MAKIQGEVIVSAKELTELTSNFLAGQVNPVTGLPFVDMNEYASYILGSAVNSYLNTTKDVRAKVIADKYRAATDAVKDQVAAILGT